MAKRMQFSVVGLPHYTIWHLYEPSVDDIRHMEEMEAERRAREQEEKERKERMEKIQSQFDVDAAGQFERDKEAIREGVKKDAGGKAAGVVKRPEGVPPPPVAEWKEVEKEKEKEKEPQARGAEGAGGAGVGKAPGPRNPEAGSKAAPPAEAPHEKKASEM